MKYLAIFLFLLISKITFAQLNISVGSEQYYTIPDQLLGVNTALFPDFLMPAPPCTKCEKSNNISPCTDVGSIACPDTSSSCTGSWRTDLPAQLESDADALNFKAMYYPEGVVSRYYHYVPGGKGFCTDPAEAAYINQWAINSGKTNPEPWRRHCNENAYNYTNFFERNIQLCRNESNPLQSKHMVISANVYFGSWNELKYTLEYCAANNVTVDAIVFGTEIEHDQSNTPSLIVSGGDTIPFSSGGSYFRRVQHVFIDSIKANPLYADIPLHFAAGIQHGGQGGCMERTYGCDDTLGKKSLWNRQIHDAIADYNQTHDRPLAFAGAVNWWWFPIFNDTINSSPEVAINDMNEFFEVGVSASGHPLCYKYPGGAPGGAFTGFDEIMMVQWGIKKFTNTCNGAGYENKFITQLFILKRILNMLENNYNLLYNPAASNGIRYTNAFFQRLGSNNGYNPLDFDPETNTWITDNISNYAFRQINSISGFKFKPAVIDNGPAKNLEAYYLHNCSKQRLFIINYSDTAFTISNLMVDSLSYNADSLFSYLETSVADTSGNSVLAPLNETNQNLSHHNIPLQDILIPAYGILEIELPFLQSPGSTEVCNGMDDDCDSEIDEIQATYYADADEDGYGDAGVPLLISVCAPPPGYVADSSDCQDDPVAGKDIYPGANEICNTTDDNCDGNIDENLLTVFYEDADDDSFGNPEQTIASCEAPPGFVADSTDCNDSYGSVHPGAIETCNELDDDCDSLTDEGVQTVFYEDEDGDGYGKSTVTFPACSMPVGYVQNDGDCNDDSLTGGAIHPSAMELCNGMDDNCNGVTDEGVQLIFYADEDGDSFGNPMLTTASCSAPAGYVANAADCNDQQIGGENIHPLSIEVCNNIDDNCDTVVDEGLQSTFFADADGDSFGNPAATVLACSVPTGYTLDSTDCDDNSSSGQFFYPGATEICNYLDDNCNSTIDEGLQQAYYEDADGDTYGNETVTVLACSAPPGFTDNSLDCNDSLLTGSLIYPGAAEVCNATDDNCDNAIDEGVQLIFYEDADGDLFGNAENTAMACTAPQGYADNNTDCNDSVASGLLIHPGAAEFCNGIDDNCNTEIDEGTHITFYADTDGDQYGNVFIQATGCSAPSGFVADSTDCNDTLAMINPGNPEICNGLDENCNTLIDEGVLTVFYYDEDGDSYGNPANSLMACSAPAGYVISDEDCNDDLLTGAAIHPSASESCNAIDDNCNGQVDENVLLVFYADTDGDGFGFFEMTVMACTAPAGYVADNTDCDDNPATGFTVSPAASETCNAIDDNCNGSIDEGVQSLYFADADSDGYGDVLVVLPACSLPSGYVTDSTDCNDTPGAGTLVYPGASELCNETDDNCNVTIDEGVQLIFYADEDEDGFGNSTVTTYACFAPQGYVSDNTDCNDTMASGSSVYPSATEVCNGIDDNCNGLTDEGVQVTFYEDADNDFYGNIAVSSEGCTAPPGFVADSLDCDDQVLTGALIHPGATELCNTYDDNCNGAIDEGVQLTFFADVDGDSYGNASDAVIACLPPLGFVSDSTDCNDSISTGMGINPAATELCNGMDENCNGSIDEGVLTTFYADDDGDSYGNKADSVVSCLLPAGYVYTNGDCNDEPGSGALIHPDAIEWCNMMDDNCNGTIDEGVQLVFYADEDGDGFGNALSTVDACSLPAGYVSNSEDCNDLPGSGGTIHPQATETCNYLDDNCDTLIDEGLQEIFFEDADGDGYGTNLFSVTACIIPDGFSTDSTDCNDTPVEGTLINPAMTEFCNLQDDDCDGLTDEEVQTVFYADADGDGFGDAAENMLACTQPVGFVNDHTDCDDNITTGNPVFPGAPESCNYIDDNCNALIDEGVETLFYEDADNDTYGNPAISTLACTPPPGFVANNLDCNDSLIIGPLFNPDILEECNGLDDNCNSIIDEGVQLAFFSDSDNDLYGDVSIKLYSCSVPDGYVADSTDCNDSVPAIHPEALESCNHIDDNCNASADEGVQSVFYEDADGDGYGNESVTIAGCALPGGYVNTAGDCNDEMPEGILIHPSAEELCNTLDDNCNGSVDESVQTVFYEDADGDSYGNALITTLACAVPAGFSADSTDCNDHAETGAFIYPNAAETCNETDDDCDGQLDEGVQTVFFVDEDGDGFGNIFVTTLACLLPVGFVADSTDCDDTPLTGIMVHPMALETCNSLDDNCNAVIDEGVQFSFYDDADNDGYGNAAVVVFACSAPSGYVTDNMDCNDNPGDGANIYPGAVEACNETDDNCNAAIDEGVQLAFYEDADNDSYGNALVVVFACTAPGGFTADNQDCNDTTGVGSNINPGVNETCNGLDDNCNGFTDEDVLSVFYADEDEDGFGNDNKTTVACLLPLGYVINNTDCNDDSTTGSMIHPLAIEICNGLDDNCNITIDEGVQLVFYADEDADGFGNVLIPIMSCTVPAGYVDNNEDCNDLPSAGSSIHPQATESCNYIDDNCNTLVDEGLQLIFFEDADGDSYGNPSISIMACSLLEGYSDNNMDCNDSLSSGAAINPVALEICNEADDNCDGNIDEGVKTTFYADADGDGFGNASNLMQACMLPDGYVTDSSDCNDELLNGFLIHPEAIESCNNLDDNCNGATDEGVLLTFYEDADNDFYGNPFSTVTACSAPAGFVSDSDDCNDMPGGGSLINPAATEVCNGIDDNCNIIIDEGVLSVFYEDADHDLFGNELITVAACTAPTGYVPDHSDCNDNGATGSSIYPGAVEVCNETDDNCDAEVDEGVQIICYADADADGFGNAAITLLACTAPQGYVTNDTDCNDDANNGAAIHPSATEICNSIDDNCNSLTDEGVLTTYFEDADGDTYGNIAVTTLACSLPAGFSSNNLDCNDTPVSGSLVHPGITEVCNGHDDNCNAQIDEGVLITFYIDEDHDTYGSPLGTTAACALPSGYVTNNTDCNDAAAGGAAVHPGAPDLCNLIDDNCNTVIDENALFPAITPSGNVGMCTNGSVLLTANAGAGITYQWLKNNKNIGGATSQTYLAKVAGTFQVKESNAFGCTATSAGVVAVVWPLPPATITPLGNLNICAAGSVVLQANAGSGYTYQWIKGSSNIAGATSQQYTATTTGTYKVIVTTSNGCTKTSTGTKVTKSCREEQGLADADLSYFNCYPNPTDGRFMIVLEQHHITGDPFHNQEVPVVIELRDALGQLVYYKKEVMHNGQFNREIRLGDHLSQGMYWVRLILPEKVYEGRVVYQH